MLKLDIEKRDLKDDLRKIRKSDKIPAVFYGKKEESTPVTVSYNDFIKTWKEVGSSSVITLSGVGEEKDALIQDIDIDHVSDKVRHIDFYIIEKDKKVEVDVPIEFIGVAPVVKELGGILVKVMRELKIEALPRDLPQNIEVDVSALVDFDSNVTIKDISLPKGVEALSDPEEVVASAAQPVEEVVEEVPTDISSIEVEKKGKKEEEGDEVEEGKKKE